LEQIIKEPMLSKKASRQIIKEPMLFKKTSRQITKEPMLFKKAPVLFTGQPPLPSVVSYTYPFVNQQPGRKRREGLIKWFLAVSSGSADAGIPATAHAPA
jgi:hypothetical protein